MSTESNRRSFLARSTTGSLLAMSGQFGFLNRLPRLTAAEAALPSGMVKFDPEIEPLVRLIEETDRSQLLEQVASRIHAGTSYQQVLAALLLAGIRNVQPRPSVGFKFHCVLCVNSCHLASLSGPDEDRWLPIFWALDYFKGAQAEELQKTGWKMLPVNAAQVPHASEAKKLFIDAMERWDVEQADTAVAGLCRSAGATEIFNLFAQFAARDFRSIGHKVIYLANSWRTLEVIGWQHAEPVLRSLAFALLNSEGSKNPAEQDLPADRPWKQNAELLKQAWPENWENGSLDQNATRDLIAQFRSEDPQAAGVSAAEMIQHGVSPQSVWDAVFVGSGELLMRQPGIVGLHGLTTANAMNYLWRNVGEADLRRQLLLQACSFNTMFRDAAAGRGALKSETIDTLPQLQNPTGAGPSLEEIFTSVSTDKMQAMNETAAYLAAGGRPEDFMTAARRMIFLKGRDAHDYKFSAAVLEDFPHVSEHWRNQFLALSVFNLRGAGDRESPVLARTREALA
ncbi:hypothetical protein SH661x_003055 [Planctomicrobium sp. SH661]|uniref:hypothetical protein n=1 Tax=Planctomicrobium sp. SH661 TaxID=3448124 RepID=UPI003F5BEC42